MSFRWRLVVAVASLSGCHLVFPHATAPAPRDAAAPDRTVPIEAAERRPARDSGVPSDLATLPDHATPVDQKVIAGEKVASPDKSPFTDKSVYADKSPPKPDKTVLPDKGSPKPEKLFPKFDMGVFFDGPCAPCVLPMTDCGCTCECFPSGTKCIDIQCKY
ncbi:MAG: hypothetical protein ACOY3Y_12325 [Acidobacteriota bacterium]